jgi:predicted acylesterase/phospholipase RssA
MRWTMLGWRAAGGFLVVVAALEMLLAMAGSSELSVTRWTHGRADPSARDVATVLDVLAWSVIGAIGVVMLAGARRAEELVARLPRGPESWARSLGVVLAFGFAAHVTTWLMDWPYPHRFSLIALLVLAVLWISVHPGRAGAWVRRRARMLLPEGGGLGLWGSEARRRMLIRWMVEGDPRRLLDPATHLIMSACDVNTGRMHYFVNWRDEGGLFARGLERRLGEVQVLESLPAVIDAALASSAIPLLFEPVLQGEHCFVDGGVFSNQPLHAVLADGADAVVVVLLAPAEGPARGERPHHVVALGFRLLEIANWRDVHAELDGLPAGWTRVAVAGPDGVVEPAPVCVVEPDRTLPGGMYGYARATAEELMLRGEEDAWRALERAGWLAPA